jgi:predicted nucleic acid-binding protein
MKELPPRLVIDASAGIKLFIDEPLSDSAHALFAQIALPLTRFFTPDLFYIECTNVIWKYVRRGGMPAADAAVAVEQLGRLGLRAVPTASLISSAFMIADAYDVTAYDAVYAAVAQQVRAPLITADERLVRQLRGSEIEVRQLT